MRIKFDISTLNPDKATGVGVYMLQLLQQSQRDRDLELVPVLKASRFKKRRKISEFFLKGPFSKKIRLYFPWSYWFQQKSLFHGPDFKLPYFAGKRVVTIHDMVVFEKAYNDVRFYEKGIEQLTKVLESSPDAILVNSDFTKNEILRFFPDLKTPIYRTYLGCDRLPVSEIINNSLPRDYFLFVGTLEKRKNLLGALKAYALYRDQGGQSHFVLAGGWGFGQDQIRQALANHPYQEFIHHLNYVALSDLGSLYKNAKIFFFPSLYEGFGIPILEAMSLGVPVVTSHFGAMREVADGAAILVNPLEAEDMAEALIRLEGSSDLRIDLAQRGLKRAAEFTWARCWQQTKEVYQLLENQRRT